MKKYNNRYEENQEIDLNVLEIRTPESIFDSQFFSYAESKKEKSTLMKLKNFYQSYYYIFQFGKRNHKKYLTLHAFNMLLDAQDIANDYLQKKEVKSKK